MRDKGERERERKSKGGNVIEEAQLGKSHSGAPKLPGILFSLCNPP